MSAAASWRHRPREHDQEEFMTGFTRRKVLTVVAATAAGAVGSANLTTQTAAQTATAGHADLELFIELSAALTGIAQSRLAPDRDPIQIKRKYFEQAQKDPAFNGLMQIIRADQSNPDAAAAKVMHNSDRDIRCLDRRSIVMSYFGSRYKPETLKKLNSSSAGPPYPPDEIISPAAYIQGWAWRIAQAHPMGYSELLFGYWSK